MAAPLDVISVGEIQGMEYLLYQLRELLTNAFDDVIEEDDSSCLSSGDEKSTDSRDSGAHTDDKGDVWPTTAQGWGGPINAMVTSTPIGRSAPPLKTPGPLYYAQDTAGHAHIPREELYNNADQFDNPHHNNHHHGNPHHGNPQYDNLSLGNHQTGYGQQHLNAWQPSKYGGEQYANEPGHVTGEPGYHREQGDGGNDPYPEYHNHHHHHHHQPMYPPSSYPFNGQYVPNHFYYDNNYHGNMPPPPSGYYGNHDGGGYDDKRPGVPEEGATVRGEGIDTSAPQPKSTAPNTPQGEQQVQVKYQGPQSQADVSSGNPPPGGSTATPGEGETFPNQVGSSENRQSAQLEILYKARGRHLEQVQRDLQVLREESDREIRVLKHKLALLQDERDGAVLRSEQCQGALQEGQGERQQLQDKLSALGNELDTLKKDKDKIEEELQSAESTIETLQYQLQELGGSDSLTRARHQHEAVVTSLQHKHELEIVTLKENLDTVQHNLGEKTEEIQKLKRQLADAVREAENCKIERAETINRLTRSLEESQRQCRDLLEGGATKEYGQLKIQVQEAIAGRSISEDMCSALKDELGELKEQLLMYESASQFGVLSPSLSASPDDQSESFAQLGIRRKMEWKTPKPHRSEALSSDETVCGLKSELERCLTNYRNKRTQVTKLQQDLRTASSERDQAQGKLDTTQQQLTRKESRIKELEDVVKELQPGEDGLSVVEQRLRKDIERLQQEKQSAMHGIQELRERLDEVAHSEEKLNEINADLRHQMSLMVSEYDEDKRIALEKCQEACLQHHESSKRALQEEHLAALRTKHDALAQGRAKVERELDEVKELYVKVCEENEENRERIDKLLRDQEGKLKEVLKGGEKEAQQKLGQEAEIKRQIEAKVALLRLDWFSEHRAAKEMAVETAVRKTEAEWKLRLTRELEEKTDAQIQEAKKQWLTERRVSFERELQQRIGLERERWQTESEKPRGSLSPAIEDVPASSSTNNQELAREVETLNTEIERLKEEVMKEGKLKDDMRQKFSLEKKEKDHLQETLLSEKKIKERLNEQVLKLEKQNDRLNEEVVRAEVEHERLKKEIKKLDLEKTRLERELGEMRAAKNELGRMVISLEEEKGTLSKDLDHVKEEKERLNEEISQKNKEMERWSQEKQTLIKNKDAERRTAVAEISEQCERDYQQFLAEHRDTLNKALISARQQFDKERLELEKQHREEARRMKNGNNPEGPPPGGATHGSSAGQWQEQIDKLRKDFQAEKGDLTRSHREAIERVARESAASWCEKEEALMVRIQQEHAAELVKEIARLRAKLEEEMAGNLDGLEEERQGLQWQVETLTNQMAALQTRYDEKTTQAEEKITELTNGKTCGEESLRSLSAQLEAEKSDHREKFSECQEQIKELVDARNQFQQSLQQKQEECEKLNYRLKQYAYKLRKTEETLKHAKGKFQSEVDKERENHKQEFSVAMEKMKEKMMEMRRKHMVAMETQRKAQATENLAIPQPERLVHTPVQTESSEASEQVVAELRGQYLEAIDKIRDDVMRHVAETNEKAAERVRSELRKERHVTASLMRKHYMKTAYQVLHAQKKNVDVASVLSSLERALDHSPSRETSGQSTPSSLLHQGKNDVSALPHTVQSRQNNLQSNGHLPHSLQHRGSLQRDFSTDTTHGNSRKNLNSNSNCASGHLLLQKRSSDLYNYDSQSATDADDTSSVIGYSSAKSREHLKNASRKEGPSISGKDGVNVQSSSSRGRCDISVSRDHGGQTSAMTDLGRALEKIPRQPRRYNPPPEKPSSAESSRCASPISSSFLSLQPDLSSSEGETNGPHPRNADTKESRWRHFSDLESFDNGYNKASFVNTSQRYATKAAAESTRNNNSGVDEKRACDLSGQDDRSVKYGTTPANSRTRASLPKSVSARTGSSSKGPMKALHSTPNIKKILASVPSGLAKPVPIVTRHAQVPSSHSVQA